MSVTLYMGPMFGGKTSALIGHYVDGKTIAFKYMADKRYSDTAIVSHDGIFIPATSCLQLPHNIRGSYETVLVDEGQFFENLREAVQAYISFGLKVYISALSGTSELTAWPKISEIIPICDDIVHLKARLCMRCRKRQAPFTAVKRGTQKKDQIEIGGADKYEPVCRFCHSAL